jgi:hypothetical protein
MISATQLMRDSCNIGELNQWSAPPPPQERQSPRNSLLIKDLGEILPWLVLTSLTAVIYFAVT